ncbi:transposase [Nocardioides nanhaiensis]|uniref:Transposase n=1 Tax=Nocardioides nanhaiensis TaxID=1476871 RepID=A0ABP8WX04_9ACTN
MHALVITADQRASRRGADLVDATLAQLAAGPPALRPFERTAGDELQGVLDDPAHLAPVAEVLLRAGTWWVGIGLGPVETPLPTHARAGRGEAYVRARAAVSSAKSSPRPVRVVGPDAVDPGGTLTACLALETALWLWAGLLERRSARGWEVADLLRHGSSHAEAARHLGISQSAVSQRAQAANLAEAQRAEGLVTHLTTLAMHPGAGTPT